MKINKTIKVLKNKPLTKRKFCLQMALIVSLKNSKHKISLANSRLSKELVSNEIKKQHF
jgi:hypothetical protein